MEADAAIPADFLSSDAESAGARLPSIGGVYSSSGMNAAPVNGARVFAPRVRRSGGKIHPSARTADIFSFAGCYIAAVFAAAIFLISVDGVLAVLLPDIIQVKFKLFVDGAWYTDPQVYT